MPGEMRWIARCIASAQLIDSVRKRSCSTGSRRARSAVSGPLRSAAPGSGPSAQRLGRGRGAASYHGVTWNVKPRSSSLSSARRRGASMVSVHSSQVSRVMTTLHTPNSDAVFTATSTPPVIQLTFSTRRSQTAATPRSSISAHAFQLGRQLIRDRHNSSFRKIEPNTTTLIFRRFVIYRTTLAYAALAGKPHPLTPSPFSPLHSMERGQGEVLCADRMRPLSIDHLAISRSQRANGGAPSVALLC